ncbi:hypothetical protein V2A60_006613 [Cordyceps javanica]
MRTVLSSRWLNRALRTTEALSAAGLPIFLCPTVGFTKQLQFAPVPIPHNINQRRLVHSETSTLKNGNCLVEAGVEDQRKLPFTCSGCGAFTQTTDSQQLGYYDITTKRVRTWLNPPKHQLQQKDIQENEIINNVLKSMDGDQLTALGFDASTLVVEESAVAPPSRPTKQSVDALMPYLREVLRDALGRLGNRVRLGNVRCVSANHGWWTRDVKEDIWRRGGAGWMVGKVNVGKSRLFEEVYPKGRLDHSDASAGPTAIGQIRPKEEDIDVGDLLPPAREVTNYPAMPLVSSLPGTTASPIRIPFGNRKGELIDLPGLARSDLDLFVKEEHRQSLIMKKRVVPEQATVKYGQSLILGGGLIRITPSSENLVFLMYNFTPLEDHITSNEKAIDFQAQVKTSGAQENIALPGTAGTIQHAGRFILQHDVTRQRAGPLTRKSAVGLNVDQLPFRVLSVDILIEGVGYVEIVAQVRTKSLYRRREDSTITNIGTSGEGTEQTATVETTSKSQRLVLDPFEEMMHQRRDNNRTAPRPAQMHSSLKSEADQPCEDALPSVDIYTPEGRFVGTRKPINGWLNNKPRILAEHKKSRPRKSMKGQKKKAKLEARAARATST